MFGIFIMLDREWGLAWDHTIQLFSEESAAVAWAVDLLVTHGELEQRGAAGWGLPGEGEPGFREAADALYAWQATCAPLEFLHVYQVTDRRPEATQPS